MTASKETRAGKYGRNYAVLLGCILETKNARYRKTFLNELQTYSFEPRIEGTPPNAGCANELAGINRIDMENPRHFAKLIKEGVHLMYQKQTARRFLYSLLENL